MGGGGELGAILGAPAGGGAVPALDQRVLFKCLTCDLKEALQDESFIHNHKTTCRALQKERQKEQQKRDAQKGKKKPKTTKTKKGSGSAAPPQPKKKGSGSRKQKKT